MINARDVLGDKVEVAPSWLSWLTGEVTHIFVIVVGAFEVMLPLLASGCLRNGAVPNASIAEHIGLHIFFGLMLLAGVAFWPGCFVPESEGWGAMSGKSLGWNATYSVPLVVVMAMYPIADGLSSDNFALYVFFLPFVVFVPVLCTHLLLLTFLRLQGATDLSPSSIPRQVADIVHDRGRWKTCFLDLLAINGFLACVVFPAAYLCIDVVYLSSGSAGEVAQTLRPLFATVVKRSGYLVFSLAAERLGATFRIYGVWAICINNAMLTAFSCTQSRDWPTIGVFLALDWLAVILKCWCMTKSLQGYRFFKGLRRAIGIGKPNPPPPVSMEGYRGYELVVETVSMSIVFVAILMTYPFVKLALPHTMMATMLFPNSSSIKFLAAFSANEILNDMVVRGFVYKVSRYRFDPLFGSPSGLLQDPKTRFMFHTIFANCWIFYYVGMFGWWWEFQKIGPWAE